MLISKEQLSGNYKWMPETENSPFTGSVSRRLFDRWNGEQVLFIINSLASLSDNFSLEEGRKAEHLIREGLPLTTQSELSVFKWLKYKRLTE